MEMRTVKVTQGPAYAVRGDYDLASRVITVEPGQDKVDLELKHSAVKHRPLRILRRQTEDNDWEVVTAAGEWPTRPLGAVR